MKKKDGFLAKVKIYLFCILVFFLFLDVTVFNRCFSQNLLNNKVQYGSIQDRVYRDGVSQKEAIREEFIYGLIQGEIFQDKDKYIFVQNRSSGRDEASRNRINQGGVSQGGFIKNGSIKNGSIKDIDKKIKELEKMKRGYEAKVLNHINLAQILQYQEGELQRAKRHWKLAEDNRKIVNKIQKEIYDLKIQRMKYQKKKEYKKRAYFSRLFF